METLKVTFQNRNQYENASRMLNDWNLEISGRFEPISVEEGPFPEMEATEDCHMFICIPEETTPQSIMRIGMVIGRVIGKSENT